MLNRLGAGRFQAYSAGSHPAGRVNPGAPARAHWPLPDPAAVADGPARAAAFDAVYRDIEVRVAALIAE